MLRRALLLLAAAAAMLASGVARAETVLIELATPKVEITSSFAGASVVVFGVIERDRSTVPRRGGYQVVLTVSGPEQTVLVQRKERVAGIWVNARSYRFTEVPSFFAVYATTPVAEIVYGPVARDRLLDLDYVGHGGEIRGTLGAREPFRAALVELKEAEGLYGEQPESIRMFRPDVFSAKIELPALVQVGVYTVTAHLFSDGTPLSTATVDLLVEKTGIEQTIFVWAARYPLPYGLGVVLMALATGYFGGILFRR